MTWISENKEWLFSGVAVAIPLAVAGWLIHSRRSPRSVQKQRGGKGSTNIQVGRDLTVGQDSSEVDDQ